MLYRGFQLEEAFKLNTKAACSITRVPILKFFKRYAKGFRQVAGEPCFLDIVFTFGILLREQEPKAGRGGSWW